MPSPEPKHRLHRLALEGLGIQLISSGVFLCPWKGAEPWRVPAHGMGRGAAGMIQQVAEAALQEVATHGPGMSSSSLALKSQVCEIACCVNDCFRV